MNEIQPEGFFHPRRQGCSSGNIKMNRNIMRWLKQFYICHMCDNEVNNDNKTLLLAMPLVLATAFSLSCPSWKTVFSVGRSSSPNTQLNHCTWPSALRGHHWLSYCQIQGHLPVLTLWISLKDRTCLMTHCFTKLSVLLVYILLFSYCFPPIFLTFPFLFCFFQWTHSVLSIPQMMTLPSV